MFEYGKLDNLSLSRPFSLIATTLFVRNAMGDTVYDIKLLLVYVDPLDESLFRILVDGKFVKYLTIDKNLCRRYVLRALLNSPPLPPGDWPHISELRRWPPHFSEVTNVELPSIPHLWHPPNRPPRSSHHMHKLQSNFYEASAPQFDRPVVVKFARFPFKIP